MPIDETLTTNGHWEVSLSSGTLTGQAIYTSAGGTIITTPQFSWSDSTATAATDTTWSWTAMPAEHTNFIRVVGNQVRDMGGQLHGIRVEPPSEERRIQNLQARTKNRILARRRRLPIGEKARDLLKLILTAPEWLEWERFGSVRIFGSEGGRYEINPSWSGHIFRLDPETDAPTHKLCYHPPMALPVEDRVASLVMEMKSNERQILEQANIHTWNQFEKDRVERRRREARFGMGEMTPARDELLAA